MYISKRESSVLLCFDVKAPYEKPEFSKLRKTFKAHNTFVIVHNWPVLAGDPFLVVLIFVLK